MAFTSRLVILGSASLALAALGAGACPGGLGARGAGAGAERGEREGGRPEDDQA